MTQPGLPTMEHKGGQYVAVGHIAQIYGVEERTVQYWAKDIPGILKNGKGQYNLLSVIRSVYTWQRTLIERNGGDSLEELRKIGQKIDNEKRQIELDQLRGKLVSADEMKGAANNLGKDIRNALDGLIPRLKNILASETDVLKCAAILQKEFNSIHNLLPGEQS